MIASLNEIHASLRASGTAGLGRRPSPRPTAPPPAPPAPPAAQDAADGEPAEALPAWKRAIRGELSRLILVAQVLERLLADSAEVRGGSHLKTSLGLPASESELKRAYQRAIRFFELFAGVVTDQCRRAEEAPPAARDAMERLAAEAQALLERPLDGNGVTLAFMGLTRFSPQGWEVNFLGLEYTLLSHFDEFFEVLDAFFQAHYRPFLRRWLARLEQESPQEALAGSPLPPQGRPSAQVPTTRPSAPMTRPIPAARPIPAGALALLGA